MYLSGSKCRSIGQNQAKSTSAMSELCFVLFFFYMCNKFQGRSAKSQKKKDRNESAILRHDCTNDLNYMK